MADTFPTELQARIDAAQEVRIQATVDAEATTIQALNAAITEAQNLLTQEQFDDSINLDTQDAALAAFENQQEVIRLALNASPPIGFVAPFTLNLGANFPQAGENNPATAQRDFSDFEYEDSTIPTPLTIPGSDFLTGGPTPDSILIANEGRWDFFLDTVRNHNIYGSLNRIGFFAKSIVDRTAHRDLVQGQIDTWELAFPPTP